MVMEDAGMARRSKGHAQSGGCYCNCVQHSIDGATNVENQLWHGIAQHNWLATRNSTSPPITAAQITADAGPE